MVSFRQGVTGSNKRYISKALLLKKPVFLPRKETVLQQWFL